MIHCCEAPIYMLSNYFGTKQVHEATFGEIWRIQIQLYPQTPIEPKNRGILLDKRSQCPWISVTCSTELKSSSPLNKD